MSQILDVFPGISLFKVALLIVYSLVFKVQTLSYILFKICTVGLWFDCLVVTSFLATVNVTM